MRPTALIWAAAVAEAAHSHTTVSALIADALENLLAIRAGLRDSGALIAGRFEAGGAEQWFGLRS